MNSLERAGKAPAHRIGLSSIDVQEPPMPKEALTITLEAERLADLDRMVAAQGRDRDTVIEEAIANWLDLQAWQAREIEVGLKDAESGNFATSSEIEAAYGRR
jgi:predicted transcriptional regulator